MGSLIWKLSRSVELSCSQLIMLYKVFLNFLCENEVLNCDD